jgi:catechol 2,3-dioxygenase-like lactoylglutathione lyase family enzyme
MALKRLDNIGIVVDDLELTIDFFQELGLHLEGPPVVWPCSVFA